MYRLLLLIMISLVSCGPSSEERASILKAQQVLIREAKGQKQAIENQISSLTAELAVQNDKLSSIQEFQFLRTTEEREQQIREQVLVINGIKKNIDELNTEISSITNQIVNLEIELTKYQDN